MYSLQEAFIHGAVWGTFYYGRTRFIWLLVTVEKKTPAHCNDNTWNSRTNFLYNSDWIRHIEVIFTEG